jgi:hypothetical protein
MIGRWFGALSQTKFVKNCKGEATGIILMFVLMFVFVFLPVFAAVFEQVLFQIKAADLREGVELSSIATYTAMNAGSLAEVDVNYNAAKLESTFKKYLASNLHLNDDLTPKATGSVISGPITVVGNVPQFIPVGSQCPDGNVATRPMIHVSLIIPIKPTLYEYTVLQLLGVSTINCNVSLDTEIVLDNN